MSRRKKNGDRFLQIEEGAESARLKGKFAEKEDPPAGGRKARIRMESSLWSSKA